MKDVFRIISIIFFVVIINADNVWIPRTIQEYPKEPVWPYYLADPGAFESNGVYYMVGTGSGFSQGNATFAAMSSHDMVTWTYVGEVLRYVERPNQTFQYWAPEIIERDNVFYLYYSVGNENDTFLLRVATSNSPLGPYDDEEGIDLTDINTVSAIDPSPFRDPATGLWYLFYTRNTFNTNNGFRIGTGIAVDRLIDMTTLAGNETIILRPQFDWQLYDPNLPGANNSTVSWYVLEAPFVWQKEPGVYVCFYSGSNWRNSTYGVDYAISYSTPMGPYFQDNTSEPRISRTLTDNAIGPGHNSIVLGRDQRTTYMVYHAWDRNQTARSPFVSQLNWKRELVPSSSSNQDFLHVTLAFLVYFIIILLIFQHAL